MAKLTLVKKIVNDEFIHTYNLILNTLFGGKLPDLYDENKTYNKGDCVVVKDDENYKIFTITKDGITGPFKEDYVEEVNFTDLFKDSSILTQNDSSIQSTQEALSDDISTLLYELAGLIDNRLAMKVLYRENFKNSNYINITNGLHVPGYIQSINNSGIDFKLKEPMELTIKPKSFKIKHYIEITGVPEIGCSITFNANDANPYWFNANDAILTSDFFEIPLNDFDKEEGVPYALDVRINGKCPNGSMIKISDLMVVFI